MPLTHSSLNLLIARASCASAGSWLGLTHLPSKLVGKVQSLSLHFHYRDPGTKKWHLYWCHLLGLKISMLVPAVSWLYQPTVKWLCPKKRGNIKCCYSNMYTHFSLDALWTAFFLLIFWAQSILLRWWEAFRHACDLVSTAMLRLAAVVACAWAQQPGVHVEEKTGLHRLCEHLAIGVNKRPYWAHQGFDPHPLAMRLCLPDDTVLNRSCAFHLFRNTICSSFRFLFWSMRVFVFSIVLRSIIRICPYGLVTVPGVPSRWRQWSWTPIGAGSTTANTPTATRMVTSTQAFAQLPWHVQRTVILKASWSEFTALNIFFLKFKHVFFHKFQVKGFNKTVSSQESKGSHVWFPEGSKFKAFGFLRIATLHPEMIWYPGVWFAMICVCWCC